MQSWESFFLVCTITLFYFIFFRAGDQTQDLLGKYTLSFILVRVCSQVTVPCYFLDYYFVVFENTEEIAHAQDSKGPQISSTQTVVF
jgi:hypothetical protein